MCIMSLCLVLWVTYWLSEAMRLGVVMGHAEPPVEDHLPSELYWLEKQQHMLGNQSYEGKLQECCYGAQGRKAASRAVTHLLG